jgi:hypothetical protein
MLYLFSLAKGTTAVVLVDEKSLSISGVCYTKLVFLLDTDKNIYYFWPKTAE